MESACVDHAKISAAIVKVLVPCTGSVGFEGYDKTINEKQRQEEAKPADEATQ
jgi:hypothetical protein